MTDLQRRAKYGDGPWVRRLTLRGRGSFRHAKPLHVLVITGTRPYINLNLGEDDRYVTSLSPAEWRRIAAHVEAHLDARGES